MDLSSFSTEQIRLSMRGDKGAFLKANVYTIPELKNEDGSLRELSIGQLVMAICMNRAAQLEDDIVTQMESLALTTEAIEALAKAENAIASKNTSDTASDVSVSIAYKGTTYTSAFNVMKAVGVEITSGMTYGDLQSACESRLDALNTISQDKLIEIQSLTSKRDDTYTLVSNVSKTLNTVQTGIVNNM